LKCKKCHNEFNQINTLQRYCYRCALEKAKELTKKKEDKAWRKRKIEMKEKIKTVSDYRNELQKFINKIARLIDYGCPCISCGIKVKKENGCHFKSVGANPSLRYNLLNIYLGCNRCNVELGGNVHGYDDGIINLFGVDFWEYLKFGMIRDFPILSLSVSEIKEKIVICKDIIRELESDLIKIGNPDRIKKRIELNDRIGIYENKCYIYSY